MKIIVVSFEFILLTSLKVNRLLLSREIRIELKKPWDLLAETQTAAREGGVGTLTRSLYLPVLNKIRIFFKANPNADF